MTIITEKTASAVDHEAHTRPLSEIAAYLQEQLGQRMAAYLVGLSDTRQIGRYARGQKPSDTSDRRLREGYKVVKMIADAYDATTAKAWLFGTNSRLDDEAPIEMIRAADTTEQFVAVKRAARQFASIDG